MLLTITTTHRPASDLGYLLHKHPARCQSFDLSFGKAHVFYPEVGAERCSACLLLDVDPVGMVRSKNHGFLLAQYVNDRPYAASSVMSVAIAQVFGSALQGRCKDRPELAAAPIPLLARIDVLPVRGGERFLRSVFEPLGYAVEANRCPLDDRFPEWGESPYFAVTIAKTTTLAELLAHLYVLIPVFDNAKHYFVGDDELSVHGGEPRGSTTGGRRVPADGPRRAAPSSPTRTGRAARRRSATPRGWDRRSPRPAQPRPCG